MKYLEKLFENVEKEVTIVKKRTTKDIIEEIHESFYTEVDKLLEQAKISKSLDTDKQYIIDKCERLKSLGFNNTKEVKEAEEELERLNILQEENEQKAELLEAIDYFSIKYPNYKFITEDSVNKICDKYGLVYGPVDRYLGTVPEENLKYIEEFKVDVIDEAWIKATTNEQRWSNSLKIEFTEFKEILKWKEIKDNPALSAKKYYINIEKSRVRVDSKTSSYSTAYKKAPLEIAAPISDFNIEGMEVKSNKLVEKKREIPDPVVLAPVIYKKKKYYLIVTAWGEEASDELVVNQKMN